jgi:hypothetical protein
LWHNQVYCVSTDQTLELPLVATVASVMHQIGLQSIATLATDVQTHTTQAGTNVQTAPSSENALELQLEAFAPLQVQDQGMLRVCLSP